MTLALDSVLAVSSRRTLSLPDSTSVPAPPAESASLRRATVQDTIKPSSANVGGRAAASEGLAQAVSIADTAQAAAGSVLQILQQLKETAAAASSPDLPEATRSGLSGAFGTLVGQIGATVQAASASGVNLIDGSALPGVTVTADPDGGQTTLGAYDLTPAGPTVGLASAASLKTASGSAIALGQVQSALEATSGVLSSLTTQAKQIGAHADFVATLGKALGAAEPDGADGVRLQALQLRQDLSQQTAAIANTAPNSVLSLFRA